VIGANLIKHISEFQRYVRNYDYELSRKGVYFAKANAWMRGAYDHWIAGFESGLRTDSNVIPVEAQNYFLDVGINASDVWAQSTSWYLGLHSGTGAEDSAIDASGYNGAHSEIQAQSGDPGGYTSATRIAWVPDALDQVNSEVENDASPAAFTVDTSTTLVVNGAWMTNKSGRTDYSGVALSIAKFTATRNLADTDVFNLKYKIDLDHV
jgi:hypothetical protein